MTTTELSAFRRALENRQTELGKRNREALAVETSPDELDRIQHASDSDYAMSNLERDANRLREVRIALRRIHAGTFGVCAGCGGNIDRRRLAAVPWAPFCIVCQGTEDRGQEMFRSEIGTSLVMAA